MLLTHFARSAAGRPEPCAVTADSDLGCETQAYLTVNRHLMLCATLQVTSPLKRVDTPAAKSDDSRGMPSRLLGWLAPASPLPWPATRDSDR